MVGRRPTPEDRESAIRIALGGVARGDDIEDVLRELWPLHPKNNTFPGEVFLELATDALELSGASRDDPIEYEGIRDRHLPGMEFRGRSDQHKIDYALSAAAMLSAGVQPDLLGEVSWWRSDDYWAFAFYALVVYLRAAADRSGEPVTTICEHIASGAGVDLPAT